MYDLLIVGAGLGGLAVARETQQAQWRTLLLEKARGVSGRAATRYLIPKPRLDLELPADYQPMFSTPTDPELHQPDEDNADDWFAKLDHGAHFFTARHERTKRLVEGGIHTGWLHEWTRQFAEWQDGEVYIPALATGFSRYVPKGGMNKLGAQLARPLDVTFSTLVTSLERTAKGWRVFERGGDFWETRRLVFNMPAPQMLAIIEDSDLPNSPHSEAALAAAKAVRYQACWAAGLVLEQDIDVDWLGLRFVDHPVLEWLSREHTKRDDSEHPPALVVQAQSSWSKDRLDFEPEQVLTLLSNAASEVAGQLSIKKGFAHRWLYSTPTQCAPYAFHWDENIGLGWCGDWCTPDEHGPRIESALLSGWRLGESLLRG